MFPLDGLAQFKDLHNFGGAADGKQPYGNLLIAGSKMYGMTPQGGGTFRFGTLFKCNLDGSGYTVLHRFMVGATDGRFPVSSLILSGATLYGTTQVGGAEDRGTVFKINTDGSGFAVLHSFVGGVSQGQNPNGSLILSGSTLYGTTTYGGGGSGVFDNCGTIFKIQTDGSGFSVIHNFFGGDTGGRSPNGALLLSGTTFYGLTTFGGPGDMGIVFKIETDGSGFTLLHTFGPGGGSGREPRGSLILSGSTLYGMTSEGGALGAGTIFKIGTDGGGFAVLHSFSGGAADGGKPWDSLFLSSTSLFGMTYQGGVSNAGTIFKIETDGNGFDLLRSFSGGAKDGKNPLGSLSRSENTFYGMTQRGGSYDQGIVFSLPPPRISGTVYWGGSGLQDVVMAGLPGNPRTDASGRYAATVVFGWNGSVTPSKAGYAFTPASSSYTGINSDQINKDYSARLTKYVRLTAPNGGESLVLGQLQRITWSSAGLSGNVRLELFRYGIKVGVIASVPIAPAAYSWPAGRFGGGMAAAGSGYTVRVVTSDSLYGDNSDDPFTLAKSPSVRVVSPNGGESWLRNSQRTITWVCVGISGNVRLVLFKGGVKLGTIATVSAFPGSYNWKVGAYSNSTAAAGNGYKVRVVTVDSLTGDTSDASFTIAARAPSS